MNILNSAELSEIQGGNLTATVDAACVTIGVGAVFIPGAQVAAAFCAGWGAGRMIGSWFD